jgi:uncharacterized protein (TIGR02596 family)
MKSRAFSLLELLVVMAILAVLSAVAIPAVTQTLRASRLGSVSQTLADNLAFARQTAVARNLSVEVRIYKLPRHNAPVGAPLDSFRAFQFFLLEERGPVPMGRPEYFSAPVVCSQTPGEAGMVGLTEQSSAAGDPGVGAFGNSVRYVSFRFTPRGSLAPGQDSDVLGLSNSFLTLVFEDGPDPAGGGNFAAVQCDPFTGRVRTIRP